MEVSVQTERKKKNNFSAINNTFSEVQEDKEAKVA